MQIFPCDEFPKSTNWEDNFVYKSEEREREREREKKKKKKKKGEQKQILCM